MGRAVTETLVSICALVALMGVLISVDPRAREQVTLRFAGSSPSAEIGLAGARLHEVATVVAVAVRDQSLAHAPMVIFVLAAVVLVLFMLRV